MLLLLAVLITLMVVVVWLAADWWDPFNDARFDPKVWSRVSPSERTPMARDLVSNHLRPGMVETQVKSLLGEPDTVWQSSDPRGNRLPGHRTIAYSIGNASFHGFDDAFVYVHMNRQNRVIAAEINGY